MQRDYLTLANGRQVHFRNAGEGAPLLMLHPSPLSSAFLEPLIQFLASDFRVIAIDTPGYGDSDPLDSSDPSLQPYVEVIGEVVDSLSLDNSLLFGNATGAQLAIESAKCFPGKFAGLVLENAAAFTDQEREELMAPYFPDLTPQEDGSHLRLAWKIARQTFEFFPWYDTSERARVASAPPPEAVVQAVALAYLNAGPNYARAYKAAFANERPEQLAAVNQPTTVLLWEDSILLDYSRRLERAGLPGNIVFKEAASGIEARYAAVRDALLEHRDRQ